MKNNKINNFKEARNDRWVLIVAIVLNSILFLSIFFLLQDDGDNSVSAALNKREEYLPSEGTNLGLSYDDINDATDDANELLAAMGIGTIQTIDDTDSGFGGGIIEDHEIGNVFYWMIYDNDIEVQMLDNGLVDDEPDIEIIYYINPNWVDGSDDQNAIESNAAIIAGQFATLPTPREGPWTELRTPIEAVGIDPDTEEETTESIDIWYVQYNHTKNGITSEDHIRIALCPNSQLYSYTKIWNMDLSSLDTTYIVTQSTAESTAETFAGGGSSAEKCFSKIVRPGYEWVVAGHPVREYGNDPVLVYEIWVDDGNDNLHIYYVEGTGAGDIVGGTWIDGYYSAGVGA